MATIFVIEEHDQLLDIWRELNLRKIKLDHIDFHCDMRDMYVDRKMSRAAWVGSNPLGLDQGNFISHAVMEHIVDDVLWAHDEPGGRADDPTSVIFESDFSYLLPWKQIRKETFRDGFSCEVINLSDWQGPRSDRWLDVDWDVFAIAEMPRDSVEHRVERFMQTLRSSATETPEFISVCYSPQYVHATREEFNKFIDDLTEMYDATVVQPPFMGSNKSVITGLHKNIPKPLSNFIDKNWTYSKKFIRKRLGLYF